ncbi:Regulatory protein AfsR [Mycolicibacterium phlei]|jgi:tetratricopeptide (TPR) repeat protein|uniref:tetratricopeptide repeat protein n=1 Tax=Mycolicibacterium phlei TaxID=1771 RepID=UPI00078C95B3|nr:tetratricopeptide repeat protein [Mycolicibacterium phlei]AMO62349.1 Regulatory protein AfsR [Mycolicibacterium phlei]STZ20559.1 Regulatory protein AfsR [Mycolicibacterium phlei]VEG10450.1 Regulatory protein AfsR [Mycobacteroides chelonae]
MPDDHRTDEDGVVRNINISATDGGVAAYRIDQVIIDGLAELQAATTVLPLDALVVEASPFVGREAELTQIADRLSASGHDMSSSIVIVSGPPGAGKTALVRHAATVASEAGTFDRVLFVDLRGYADDPNDRVQPAVVLSKLLILLGVEDSEIAADPAEQAIQYQERLTALAAEGKSVLLWLDNASDPSQFGPLRPASAVHRVVVTTRETFASVPKPQVVDVGVMESDDAVELLVSAVEARIPDDARLIEDPQTALRLAELCDHLPLALQIVSALLADEPDRPISELVIELASEEDRLNSLDYGGELSVRAAFALSYRRLPDNLKRLFRLLSVVPGGDVGLVAAGWLIDASHTAVRPQLMALVRSHLIQQHVRNRWSMHDLLRLYSAELSAEHPEDAERALKVIVVKYLLGVGAAADWLTGVPNDTNRRYFPTAQHAAAWFEEEHPTASAIALSVAKRPEREYRELTLALAVGLGEILGSQRHWLKEFHDVAVVGASLVPAAENRHYAACVLNHYGSALRKMRQFDDALEAFRRAAEVAEEAGLEWVAGAARTNMGNVYLDQGRDVDEVVQFYWEDVRACQESDPPHRRGEAAALSNIGGALGDAGRYTEALSPLREAMSICRDLDDKPGIASAGKNLGAVLGRLARIEDNQAYLEEAIALLQEAAEIYKERGNYSGWAEVANNLGQAQCQLRRFSEGIPNLEAALRYFEESGQSDLAKNVREDVESYRMDASGGRPWSATTLEPDRYRFTNTSGGRLAQITLAPFGATQVMVENSPDPHIVPEPVANGGSFVAVVRGRGMRITATAMPSMVPVYLDFSPA